MNCAAVENILDLFVENRLTPARMLAVERHLGSCDACTRQARDFRAARLSKEAVEAAPQSLLDALEKL